MKINGKKAELQAGDNIIIRFLSPEGTEPIVLIGIRRGGSPFDFPTPDSDWLNLPIPCYEIGPRKKYAFAVALVHLISITHNLKFDPKHKELQTSRPEEDYRFMFTLCDPTP